jgi:2-methylisocitrate lyase-like PEP mutase family enzyme
MTASQNDKARTFRALHERPGAFVIPNPFDAGTARILAGLGFGRSPRPAPAAPSASAAGMAGSRATRPWRTPG